MAQFDEPALVLTYGPQSAGKTSDVLYSFPDALYIAAPGALKTSVSVVGLPYAPARAAGCKTIMQATELIRQEKKKRKWRAFAVDDWSIMCEDSFNEIEKAGKPGLQFWGRVRDALIDFRGEARDAGAHLILTCHERGPHTDEKKGFCRGGPAMPGTMPEDLPKSCDMCLRVLKEPSYPIWPMVYSAKGDDENWVEKDRHDFVPPSSRIAPMNLGELLRRGFGTDGPLGIQRARGLEWMEKVVEQIAARLAGTVPGDDNCRAILRAFRPLVEKKYTQNPLHVQWVFRDAIARACLRDAHARDRFAWL